MRRRILQIDCSWRRLSISGIMMFRYWHKCEVVPVGNLIRLASEAESRNVSIL
jgi:hypothetical protein